MLTKVFDQIHQALWERKEVEAFEEARAAVRTEVESLLELAERRVHGGNIPDPARRRRLLYNIEEAAQQLGGISTRTVYKLLRAGELESVMIGSRRLVPDATLEAYVEKLRAKAAIAAGVDAAAAAGPAG
ncbi:helix-turn-helix domain-containing protein [Micromonospora sp. NPDC005413]|uniref:helix-turn-helix domain-containing protein n=1 Tax=Micromonospora sp. NPDC005413 TaxID=3154563 RepID=UPI0033B4E7C7